VRKIPINKAGITKRIAKGYFSELKRIFDNVISKLCSNKPLYEIQSYLTRIFNL